MSTCHINQFVVEEQNVHIIGPYNTHNLHFRACAHFTKFYEMVLVGALAVILSVGKLFSCLCVVMWYQGLDGL